MFSFRQPFVLQWNVRLLEEQGPVDRAWDSRAVSRSTADFHGAAACRGLSQDEQCAINSTFPDFFLRFVSRSHVKLLRAFAVSQLPDFETFFLFLFTSLVNTIGQVSL